MKSVQLLYGQQGFLAGNRPDHRFSIAAFEKECDRQHLTGSTEVVLEVIFHTDCFLVLPNEAEETAFFRFHYPEYPQAVLQTRALSDCRQKMVCDIDPELEQTATAMLPQHHLLPDAFLFAEYVIRHSEKQTVFFVYHQSDRMQIFSARHGKLTFANSFKISSDEEKRYFILSVQHSFGETDTCLLCTPDFRSEALEKLIEPYFQHIKTFTLCEDNARIFRGNISDNSI